MIPTPNQAQTRLDLFRYPDGARDWTVGGAPFLTGNGGAGFWRFAYPARLGMRYDIAFGRSALLLLPFGTIGASSLVTNAATVL